MYTPPRSIVTPVSRRLTQIHAVEPQINAISPNFNAPQAGLAILRRVLASVACHCPHVGYCQGMNYLAGESTPLNGTQNTSTVPQNRPQIGPKID